MKPTQADQVAINKELMQTIGHAMRRARTRLGLTQEVAAEQIGVTSAFYSRLERGGAFPSVQRMVTITEVLDVSADILLGDVMRRNADVPPVRNQELRRVLRKLEEASPETRRLVSLLVKSLAD